jgi:hypothetical protein
MFRLRPPADAGAEGADMLIKLEGLMAIAMFLITLAVLWLLAGVIRPEEKQADIPRISIQPTPPLAVPQLVSPTPRGLVPPPPPW